MGKDSFQLPKAKSRRSKEIVNTEPQVEILSPKQTTGKRNSEIVWEGKRGHVVLEGEQLGRVIERGFDNIGTIAEIAKGLVEIKRIREQGVVVVNTINAQTRQLEVQLEGEIKRLQQENEGMAKRGESVTQVIRATLEVLPPEDRIQAVQFLPQLIDSMWGKTSE